MTTTALTHEERATEFAAAVREHLADLPAAELDELRDGLQADVAERLEDGGELGDTAAYAAELRQAAGLPERSETVSTAAKPKRTIRESLRETGISIAKRTRTFWAATPARRAIVEFLVSLRPVWWVLRGMIVAWALLMLAGHPVVNGVPISPLALLLTGALVVVSVQWGRGRWALQGWLVVLRRIASVVAVVLVIPVVGVTVNAISSPVYVDSEPFVREGLFSNEDSITNIFAFDCTGAPLNGVQLFDQDGQPITTLQGDPTVGGEPMWGFDEERQQNITYGRNGIAGYSGMWNVYPLQEGRANLDRDPADAKMKDAKWPLEHTLPISPECAPSGGSGVDAGAATGPATGAGGSATSVAATQFSKP